MPLVPTDFPTRLKNRGLSVHVEGGWESRGSSANHGAVVLHWTASGSGNSARQDVDYSTYNHEDAPHYNIIVDRTGVVYVCAREKTNNAGKINSTALNECLGGSTHWKSAASRGLSDNTSANDRLFAISCQNNGTGEKWSQGLINATAITAAEALKCLGLEHPGWLTHHMALTARKIDLTPGTGGCPGNWQQLVFMNWGSNYTGPPPPSSTKPPSTGQYPPYPGTELKNYIEGHGTNTWQGQMAHRGWNIMVDNKYGNQSENVCRQFQSEKGLGVDGIVGPKTWNATWTAPIT